MSRATKGTTPTPATNPQIGRIARLLRLDAPPKPADAADALALAICHIWRAPALNRLQQAHAAARRTPAPTRTLKGTR